MKHALPSILAGTLLLSIATATVAAAAIEIRLKDGSRWTGELQDRVELTYRQRGVEIKTTGTLVQTAAYFITIETNVAGEIRRKTIFKDDIVKLRSTGDRGDVVMDINDGKPLLTSEITHTKAGDQKADRDWPGVFVLPLKGGVGVEFRHDEIVKVAEEADKYGHGQIIVLHMDSGGGAGTEMQLIHASLVEIKKRHRVVAWIKEAFSAACAAAIHCDEIYFMTNGTAGSMTGYNGATMKSLSGEELEDWLKRAGEWAEVGGHSRYIAEAMIHNEKLLSYDKDPVTGEVTFHDDLSGEHILSRTGENLAFTASSALDCGFSDGTADSVDELAELLEIGEWYEASDYGRRLAKNWQDTVKKGQRELALLQQRLSYAGTGSGDPIEIQGKQIQILEKVIRWHDRCPPCTEGWPSKADLRRRISVMRKELADMKKRRR